MTLTPYQIGWIAGFIDGEGHIGIHTERDRRKGPDYSYPRVSLQVVNTDVHSILELQRLLGGVGEVLCVRDGDANHKPLWRFHLRALREVRDVLRLIEPHLVIKRERAQLVALFCDSRLAKRGAGRHIPFTQGERKVFLALKGQK